MVNCIFSGNSADSYGGGMYNRDNSSPMVTNCTFSGNSAGSYGGGMCNDSNSNATLANCTFSGNSGLHGKGLACCVFYGNPSTIQISNCIFWDGGGEIWNNDGSTIIITYSDVQDGWPGVGNIDADPLFVDANGPDGITGTEDDNLRLSGGSPCIDAADNTAVPPDIGDLDADGDTTERTPLDLDGNPRFIDDPTTTDTGVPDLPDYPEIVDMGAYEFGPFCGDPDHPYPPGDVNKDCEVNFLDIAVIANNWLSCTAPKCD